MWLYLLIHVAASLEIDGGHVQQETTNKFIVKIHRTKHKIQDFLNQLGSPNRQHKHTQTTLC